MKTVGEVFLQLFGLGQFAFQLLFNAFSLRVRSRFLQLVGSCSIDFPKVGNTSRFWQSCVKLMAPSHLMSRILHFSKHLNRCSWLSHFNVRNWRDLENELIKWLRAKRFLKYIWKRERCFGAVLRHYQVKNWKSIRCTKNI